jgi:CRP/FNR family transcriptional regulator, cyclic AMP receptor protein
VGAGRKEKENVGIVAIEILEQLSLFCDLTSEELDSIRPLCQLVEGKPGDSLVREGEEGKNLYILVSGEAHVNKTRTDGKQVHIGSLGKDDLVGEITFYKTITPAAATVEAKTIFTAVAIKQREFHRFLDKRPPLGFKLYKHFARIMSGRFKNLIGQFAESVKVP